MRLPSFIHVVLIACISGLGVFAGSAAWTQKDAPGKDEPGERVTITHGPILGRPGAHEIGIWARTDLPGKFRVVYGTDPYFRKEWTQRSVPVVTHLDRDNTGWILLTKLAANTKYYYRLVPDE